MANDRKGIWIPIEVWNIENLNIIEKLFLVEISSLANKDGCFASNAHFSDFFKLSKNRCSEIIKKLEKLNYISITYNKVKNSNQIDKRVIKIDIRLFDKVFGLSTDPIRNIDRGYSENREGINTSIINTNINKYIVELVEHLNRLTNSKYSPETKETVRLITNALKTYTIDDLKLIVDNMVTNWTGTEWEQYLRPSTLFRESKLEQYLNWKPKTKGNNQNGGNYIPDIERI